MIAGLVFVAVMARRRPLAWDTVTLGGALVALAVALPGQSELWLRLHGDAGGEAMVEEDATGMAAMIPGGGRWSLWVNGRTNSSLPFGGFHTLLGAAPAVMHAEPREVAIVGLGSGDTAWASACRRETAARHRLRDLRAADRAAPAAGAVSRAAAPAVLRSCRIRASPPWWRTGATPSPAARPAST